MIQLLTFYQCSQRVSLEPTLGPLLFRYILNIYCVKEISRCMVWVTGMAGLWLWWPPRAAWGEVENIPTGYFCTDQPLLGRKGEGDSPMYNCTLRAQFYFASRAVCWWCRWCRWLDNKQQRSTLAHLWLAPHRESQLYSTWFEHTPFFEDSLL